MTIIIWKGSKYYLPSPTVCVYPGFPLTFQVCRLNIMTYEYAGPSYSAVTNNNSPMVDPDTTSDSSIEVSIKEWIAAGASPSKIVLGMYFPTSSYFFISA